MSCCQIAPKKMRAEAQDPRRKELIAHTLDDLNRLCDRAKEQS